MTIATASRAARPAVVRPLPGAGLAVRAGDLLLVCADGGQEVDELLGLVAQVAAAGDDGGLLVRRVAALLAEDVHGRFPACALTGPTRDGRLAVLVHGAATADLVGEDGDVSLAGADAITSVNRLITGPVTLIRLRLPGAGEPDPRSHLDSGVVVAGGLLWTHPAESSTVDGRCRRQRRSPRRLMRRHRWSSRHRLRRRHPWPRQWSRPRRCPRHCPRRCPRRCRKRRRPPAAVDAFQDPASARTG